MANLALIATNRSLSRPVWSTLADSNPSLRWLGAGAIVVLAAIVYTPFLRNLFRVTTLHVNDVIVIAAATFGGLIWMEAMKRLCMANGTATTSR